MLTAEQLEQRKNYIGASEAAAVLGMSRWSSPLKVWAEKTGLLPIQDLSQNLPIKLGNKLEQTVAELFMEDQGKKVQRVNETLFHPKYPFIATNLDRRVVGEKAVLECKTASAFKRKEWEGDEFPVEYVLQVMHQLAVSGAERGYLAVLIGNQDFKVKVIERDEKALADLIRREVEFWEKFVVPKVMPDIESIKPQDKDTISELFPNAAVGRAIEMTDTAAILAENLEALEQDYKSLEIQITTTENQLKVMLGEAETGVAGVWEVGWKNRGNAHLDQKGLKAAYPNIYQQFFKRGISRVFQYKKKNQKEHIDG